MHAIRWMLVGAFALSSLFQYGCTRAGTVQAAEYNLGDKVQVGPLIYHVMEADWRTQLGEFPSVRMPERKFLLIRLSVTNSGGGTVMIPQAELENSRGDSYQEL